MGLGPETPREDELPPLTPEQFLLLQQQQRVGTGDNASSSLASMLLLNRFAGQNAHPTNDSPTINLMNLHEDLLQMRSQQTALMHTVQNLQTLLLQTLATHQQQKNARFAVLRQTKAPVATTPTRVDLSERDAPLHEIVE